MEKEEKIILKGKVKEMLRGTKYIVVLENGHEVLCTISGKLRINKITIVEGDTVDIHVSPYDLKRGIIIWRTK